MGWPVHCPPPIWPKRDEVSRIGVRNRLRVSYQQPHATRPASVVQIVGLEKERRDVLYRALLVFLSILDYWDLVNGAGCIANAGLLWLRFGDHCGYGFLFQRFLENFIEGAHVADFQVAQDFRRQVGHGVRLIVRRQ